MLSAVQNTWWTRKPSPKTSTKVSPHCLKDATDTSKRGRTPCIAVANMQETIWWFAVHPPMLSTNLYRIRVHQITIDCKISGTLAIRLSRKLLTLSRLFPKGKTQTPIHNWANAIICEAWFTFIYAVPTADLMLKTLKPTWVCLSLMVHRTTPQMPFCLTALQWKKPTNRLLATSKRLQP